jgi:hypothetical protein
MVSWAGHFLAVIAVALIGRHRLARSASNVTVTSPNFWLPVLGIAADPLLMFVSCRIWIDSLLAGLVALSVAVLVIAEGRRRRVMLVFAGGLLGLAALAKLTALMLIPVFLVAGIRGDSTWKERSVSVLAVVAPIAVVVAPWMAVFHLQYGVFVPSWVKPDARLMELYPFVRMAVERPWYYYAKLILIMPLALVALWSVVRERAAWRNQDIRVAIGWFSVIVAGLTLMGADGYGFQMRHIAPAVTAVYVIVLSLLLERDRPVLLMVCGFAILLGAVTGAMHLLVPEFSEMLSLAGALVSF